MIQRTITSIQLLTMTQDAEYSIESYVIQVDENTYTIVQDIYIHTSDIVHSAIRSCAMSSLIANGFTLVNTLEVNEKDFEVWEATTNVDNNNPGDYFLNSTDKLCYFNFSRKWEKVTETDVHYNKDDEANKYRNQVSRVVPFKGIYATNGKILSEVDLVVFDDTLTDDRAYIVYDEIAYNSSVITWTGINSSDENLDEFTTVRVSSSNAIKKFRVNGVPQLCDEYFIRENGTYVFEVELANGYSETRVVYMLNPKAKPWCSDVYVVFEDDNTFEINMHNLGNDIVWKSTNKNVVTVDSKGLVIINSVGFSKVKATSDYGSAETLVCILPEEAYISHIKSLRKGIIVKWKADKRYDKVQIQISTNGKRPLKKKTYNIKDFKEGKFRIKNLKKDTDYFVKIRGVLTHKGKNYHSDWSEAKLIKTR